MAEIVACPACQKKLQVPESFFGQTVQCPECKSMFVAQPPPGMAPVSSVPPPTPSPAAAYPPPPPPPTNAAPPPSPPMPAPSSKPPEWDKPTSGRQRDWGDEEEQEKPKSRKRKSRYDDEEDEDADDRPRRRRYREPVMPHRGGAVLVLGIIGFLFCLPGIILGPLAWSMGSSDLEAMRSGRMDPDGEGITQAGRILGIISTIASVGVILLFCLGIVMGNQR